MDFLLLQEIQYHATRGILLPAPNAFDEILNTGGDWYLLYSLKSIILMTLSTVSLSEPSFTILPAGFCMGFLYPTALIYSSHNRCEYLHRNWIVQRALEHPHNKSVLYLPFGMESRESQEFSWGTFKWYFDHFTLYGLDARVFFWSDGLSHHDAEIFFRLL